ncbi:MAG: peroxide stress protein YaaA [Cellvibrionaceae bacterium]|nr:peroxide stress protein YaaA [Cellvibrionaceae bacterium]
MLILISPAKTLDFDTPPLITKATQPLMLEYSQQLIDQLRLLAPHDLSALMGISDKLGLVNYDRYQQWQRPFSKANAKQAVLAFKGDVYTGLDAETFSPDDINFAQQHLRILSGLYGVLRPLDLIQPYRLEMGTTFANAKGKDLYHFWGDAITQVLNKQLRSLHADTLINLASNEYFKAVQAGQLNARVITPVFKDKKKGEYKIISFFAKKARGLMSAYIIKKGISDPAKIKRFTWGGYQYNKALTQGDNWVFTRDEVS